jgi:hypothetical protein
MESEEVHIIKLELDDMYKDWLEHNQEAKHPVTEFYQSLGLFYKRSYRNGHAYIFGIDDKKKLFMAKIKYGI